jgi:acyl-CoA thioesterase-1
MTKLKLNQLAESFVFVNEEKQRLQFRPAVKGSVRLRSHTDSSHSDVVTFVEGVDYEIDYENGLIARASGSRIPNWSKHVLYGISEFDHTLYDDYSNRSFTVYADYEYVCIKDGDAAQGRKGDGIDVLLSVKQKLGLGKEITYVVYGDSISEGGEASEDRFAYYSRFAACMADRYPRGSFRIVNKAIGGETSEGGASRVSRDVISQSPDLVTIGYGMNDQNKFEYGNSVPLVNYEANIRFIIQKIRHSGDTAVILVTPCQPNPLWQHTSGQIGEYAEVLRRLAEEYHIGVADAYNVWQHALNAGKSPEGLLLNNINHPNDYGHWLYYKAIEPLINESEQ